MSSESPYNAILGPTLEGKSGPVSTAEALAGASVVGLYFSAHWCPPCKIFTPELVEYYKLLKSQGKPLEIVFVSSDRDATSFNEYYNEMPWLALPYASRDVKQTLAQKYKVQGIPMFILLDEAGKVITLKARENVSQDPRGEDFPYMPKPLIEILGPSFVTAAGKIVTIQELAGKIIGLYFSASWCPPCREFTPELATLYATFQSAGRTDFEIIFITNDRDEASFNEYFQGHHPWLAVPYTDRKRISAISNHFDVEGLPTLLILDQDLKLITAEGVQAVAHDSSGADFPWVPKPLVDLSEGVTSNGYDINSKPALVAFAENLDDEEQGELTAALLSIALEYAEEGKVSDDGPRVIFFTNNTQSQIGSRVRDMVKLGDAASSTAVKIVLMDICDQGGYYLYDKGEDVSQEAIRAFLDDFHAKKLTRQQLGPP